LDLKSLLNYKTVLFLLFVVAANFVVFVLLWRLDGFIHVDLYSYGLIFNGDWANEYWQLNGMLWTFLAGTTVFAAVSMVMHYFHSKKPSNMSKWAGFFVPVIAMVFQAISIMYLNQINGLVWNNLYEYGVRYDIDWSTTYNPISMPALTLMAVALLALIIPAIRTLDIIKIEIVQEDEFENVATEDSEKDVEQQEIIQPLESLSSASTDLEKEETMQKIFAASTVLEREDVERKNFKVLQSGEQEVLRSDSLENSSSKSTALGIDETRPSLEVLQLIEPADDVEKLGAEDKKPEKVNTEALTVTANKTTKKRRKHSRRKRGKNLAEIRGNSGKTATKEKKLATAKAEKLSEQKTTQKAMRSSLITPEILLPERKKTLEIARAEKLIVKKTGKKRKKRSRRKRRKTRTKAPSPQA